MGSRANNKKKAKGLLPEKSEERVLSMPSHWDPEEGIPLTKKQERWLDMFFAVVASFAAVGGISYELLESWVVALGCAVVASTVAVVLVRRGDTIF